MIRAPCGAISSGWVVPAGTANTPPAPLPRNALDTKLALSIRPGVRSHRKNPECAVLLYPCRAFVAQQRAPYLARIVAHADRDTLKAFRMLVAAEAVGQEIAHVVGDGLRIAMFGEFDDGMHPLPEFGIGQTDDDAGTNLRMRADRGFDLGRIDIGAAAQDHVGQPVAEIEVAVGIEPSDIAQRLPAVGATLR